MLHAMVTLLFAAAGWLCHIPALAWLCAAFYVGREHAQAEYRWIDAYGGRQAGRHALVGRLLTRASGTASPCWTGCCLSARPCLRRPYEYRRPV